MTSVFPVKRSLQLRSVAALNPATPFDLRSSFQQPRFYATLNTLGDSKVSSRKQVTVRNDDGRVQWKDLSVGEKAARTTQQTFNFGVVFLGLGMTVGCLGDADQRLLM